MYEYRPYRSPLRDKHEEHELECPVAQSSQGFRATGGFAQSSHTHGDRSAHNFGASQQNLGASQQNFGASQQNFGHTSYSPSRQPAQRSQRGSPLQPRDEDQLFASFREMLLLERELERAKVDLITTCPDFNLYDAFKLLDRGTKGWIQSFDLRDAMTDPRGIDLPDFSLEDVDLFLARYDRDNDRKLRFSEFCDAFTPMDKFHADIINRRQSVGYSGHLSEKALMIYRLVWTTHQRIEKRAEHLRQKLLNSPTFSIYDAFQRVDINGDGKITSYELRAVIEQYGFPCT